jgi:hypothetical protein
MNQREKILAATVGGLLLVVVLYFAYTWISDAFDKRQSGLETAQQAVKQREFTVALGEQAAARLERYRQRSLPGELSQARSQYEAWLIATTVEFFGKDEAGNSKVAVKPKPGRTSDDVFVPVAFSINGEGNLEQFTRFLHHFYDVDYLHRIQVLHVSPVKDSRNLKISCDVEALMVIGADENKKLADTKGNRLSGSLEDDYLDVILGRNLFGPPNNPPEPRSVRTPSAYVRESMSETITARDRDPLDSVTFRLEQGPAGMTVEAGRGTPGGEFSARLSWRPERTGRYDVVIAAIDDGYPNKVSLLEFEVSVTEQPTTGSRPDPPKPEFDHSRYTFLTSVQQIDGQGLVWFYTRTKNEKIVCREGDEVKVGPYTALVKRIDIDQLKIELEVEDEVLVLALGQSLPDARPKAALKVGSTARSGAVAPLD